MSGGAGFSDIFSAITEGADTTSDNITPIFSMQQQGRQAEVDNALKEAQRKVLLGKFDIEQILHNLAMRDRNDMRQKQRDMQRALRSMPGQIVQPAASQNTTSTAQR